MKPIRLLVAAVTAVCIATAAAPVHAVEVPPDINALDYEPIGHFKPGDPLPPANGYNVGDTADFFQQEMADGIFNPSGNFNAYDTNVFEILAMPFRAAGDEHSDDPYGNGQDGGAAEHGRCSGDPRSDRPRGGAAGYPIISGECFNHQLEYIDYYERTMMSILGKFGAFTKRYEFYNPSDPTNDQFQPPLLASNTMGGRAFDPAVIVPGTGESDESIVIGAHYDKTNDGPASAWDSQEGHAQMIRVAKLMADYWDEKGARPTATVKFIPWDGEESGLLGSSHYANNVIPPGDEENKVRGYWNTDPCAGGYPAFRFGNRLNRTQLGIQLANPFRGDDTVTGPAMLADENLPDKYHARINAFNDAAPTLVEQVFDYLDDNLESQQPDQPEIYVSTAEGPPVVGGDIGYGADPAAATKPVTIGKSRPVLFGSDWLNFENRGIPFFNPGPEITGPGSLGDPGNPDALVILHSPHDNLEIMNRYAGAVAPDTVAEGWVKGMEMCAHMLAWGMLQPGQGGASLEEVGKLTAYYEALPNEAGVEEPVFFDASGSHIQTGDATTSEGLTYAWEFGDGATGTGKTIHHRYAAEGTYQSKLTVTNPDNGQTATMEIPIVVQATPAVPLPIPALTAPETDEDGTFDLDFSIRDTPSTMSGWQILEAADYRKILADDMEGPVDAKWSASEPTHPDIEPWQESDSSAQKFRGNAFSSGEQSYWTGIPNDKLKPADAQNGQSILTLKEPLQVPPEAGAEFKYNSLFIAESNDRGFVQIAEAGTDQWETIDIVGGSTDVCSPSDTKALNGDLVERGADLSSWAGKQILVRFVFSVLDANQAASQPCGWYVDDVSIAIGTFKPIDRTNAITDVGQFFEGKYTVRDRVKGVYAYRVQGLYPPNGEYEGQASNIRIVDVTTGGTPKAPEEKKPDGGGPGPQPPAPAVCPYAPKFRYAQARPRGRGLRFRFATAVREPTTVDVFQTSRARRVIGGRRVAHFTKRHRAFTWNGRTRRRGGMSDGTYFARFTVGKGKTLDVRRVTLLRRNGRFRVTRPHHRRTPCQLLRTFKLSRPAFGGTTNKRLGIAYRLLTRSRVTITVRRGGKVVRRFRAANRNANRTYRNSLSPRRLRRGVYRVTATVRVDGRTVRAALFSRKI